jgi:hypothetical protein
MKDESVEVVTDVLHSDGPVLKEIRQQATMIRDLQARLVAMQEDRDKWKAGVQGANRARDEQYLVVCKLATEIAALRGVIYADKDLAQRVAFIEANWGEAGGVGIDGAPVQLGVWFIAQLQSLRELRKTIDAAVTVRQEAILRERGPAPPGGNA